MNNLAGARVPVAKTGLPYPCAREQIKNSPDVKLMYVAAPGGPPPTLAIRCRSENYSDRQTPGIQFQNVPYLEQNYPVRGITVELSYGKSTTQTNHNYSHAEKHVYASTAGIHEHAAHPPGIYTARNNQSNHVPTQDSFAFRKKGLQQLHSTHETIQSPRLFSERVRSDLRYDDAPKELMSLYSSNFIHQLSDSNVHENSALYPESRRGAPSHYLDNQKDLKPRRHSVPAQSNQTLYYGQQPGRRGRGTRKKSSFVDVMCTPKPAVPFHLLSFAISIPHPDKIGKHGEDAHFLMNDAIGVFDGVGGWEKSGVDAGRYSKNLATLTSSFLIHYPNESIESAIHHAVSENRELGSSTACAISVKDGQLFGINIGDSGLVVIRKGKSVFHSMEQNHGFNHPYQVSYENTRDMRSAQNLYCPLANNDIIIMASDGLWDNLFLDEIFRTVSHHTNQWKTGANRRKEMNGAATFSGRIREQKIYENQTVNQHRNIHSNLTNLGLDLAKRTCQIAHSLHEPSPFAQKSRAHGISRPGGKPDDITIIVAMVTDAPEWYRSYIEAECPNCDYQYYY